MATQTANLGLALPGYEDAADIAVLNQNAQKLDEQVLHWNMAPYPATATLTPSGALELSGVLPADKDGLTVQFVSPAAATDGLQMKFAGSDTLYPILTTGEGKEPISAGAWDQGVPVTLTVSGGSCFFKGGGAGFPAGWNEKGQGIAWDDITKNSPIVQREYGKIEDGLQALPEPDVLPTGLGVGCAFSPDNNYLAVAHVAAPYITIYKRSGDTFTKLPNPAVLPTGNSEDCAFSPDNNYLAVAHIAAPYITIYKRSGDTFTKLPNLAVLPTGSGYGCAFSPDNNYLAVAHYSSPYITIYKCSGDTFTKLPNPAVLPTKNGEGCAFSPDNNYLAVAHLSSPYITIYKRTGDPFVKLEPPDGLPVKTGNDCAFSPNGNYLVVANSGSSPLTIYRRFGDVFSKLEIPNMGALGAGNRCSFSSDGRLLALAHNLSPHITIYLNEQKTYIHTLNDINKEYFAYAPKGKIGVAKESKPAGELVKATLFPALYNLTNEGGN